MEGTYSEKLKTGGELIVLPLNWNIRYYFSGPDQRYNGTFVTLNGNEIDKYIDAWADNFEKYMKLKETVPAGGQFETVGNMNMTIRIGFAEGVCLRSYHMPIRTHEKIVEVISDYEYARNRALKIMEMLKNI